MVVKMMMMIMMITSQPLQWQFDVSEARRLSWLHPLRPQGFGDDDDTDKNDDEE